MEFLEETIAKPELPHDFDAEVQLIGWALADQKLLNHVFLDVSAFYEPFHAEIWQAIIDLSNKGQSISPYTIKPLLADNPENPNIIQYLAKCLGVCLTMGNPLDGAKYLSELQQKRILLSRLSEVDTNEGIGACIGKLMALTSVLTEKTEVTTFEDALTVADAIIKDLANHKKPYSTGLLKLDEAMDGGLYEGKSYGFAARKKVGKTALAATISANLNESGVKHLFVCLEMSSKEIHQRVLARTADIYPTAFRSDYGKSPDFHQKMVTAISGMKRNTLYKNAPSVLFDELRQIFTIAVEKHAVKGIILDYWQLVGGKPKGKSTAEHLDDVAQWIADFGRIYNVWTITFAQINQEGNTRGGEGIRMAFDQLYQIHREKLNEPHAWLEMMETRYTQWLNPYGDKDNPKLFMEEKGVFFREIG